jgi:hypothetical protein
MVSVGCHGWPSLKPTRITPIMEGSQFTFRGATSVMSPGVMTMEATTLSGTRQVRVGSSSDSDARTAGRAAAAAALGDDTRLLVVLTSSLLDLDALSAGIAEVAAGVPLIGCTTAGEIASAGPGDSGVVVLGLGGTGFSIATGMATISNGDIRAAAAEASRCVDEVTFEWGPHTRSTAAGCSPARS